MICSVVIISANRRATLLANLHQVVRNIGLADGEWELLVIDNGSADGTAAAVMEDVPKAQVVRLPLNIGMPARNIGLERARGEFILLLDDDSHPLDRNTVPAMVKHLRQRPHTGAVTARVLLPDDREEASALPSVLIGCGSMLRTSAIKEVGFFPPDFFRQAEEYDLSFRLWHAGWAVDRLETAEIRHNKSPHGRSSELTLRMDLRNNLVLADRYLPQPWRTVYREDWTHRYSLIARLQEQPNVAESAIAEADAIAADPAKLRRQEVSGRAVEAMFNHAAQSEAVSAWAAREKLKTVAIADYGKNLHATVRACHKSHLTVRAIIDGNFAPLNETYRDLPIVSPPSGRWRNIEGVVVSNINPAQQPRVLQHVRQWFDGPVLSFNRTAIAQRRAA